jgi:4-oxalocrotonate tautomerase
MPIVRIETWEGKTDEQKERLIREVTKCVSDVLDVGAEHIRVVIYDVPKANWGIQGEPASKI